MTTKTAIIATVAIFVGALLLATVVLMLFIDPNARDATERAGQLGQGIGLLCLIPLGVIWIMWAARVRKERERKRMS
jgi:cadmium resistance protein CadD (predicted permease)